MPMHERPHDFRYPLEAMRFVRDTIDKVTEKAREKQL
jgi:hypothetical protein